MTSILISCISNACLILVLVVFNGQGNHGYGSVMLLDSAFWVNLAELPLDRINIVVDLHSEILCNITLGPSIF